MLVRVMPVVQLPCGSGDFAPVFVRELDARADLVIGNAYTGDLHHVDHHRHLVRVDVAVLARRCMLCSLIEVLHAVPVVRVVAHQALVRLVETAGGLGSGLEELARHHRTGGKGADKQCGLHCRTKMGGHGSGDDGLGE